MHPPRETKRIWRNDDESEIYVTKATSATRHPVPALLLCVWPARNLLFLLRNRLISTDYIFPLFQKRDGDHRSPSWEHKPRNRIPCFMNELKHDSLGFWFNSISKQTFEIAGIHLNPKIKTLKQFINAICPRWPIFPPTIFVSFYIRIFTFHVFLD